MKEIIYIVESRNTKTNDFISDSGFARYKNAKEYFDKGYAPLTEKQIKEWKSLDISL